MSFLIDGPWLYANGRVLARVAPEPARHRLAIATIAAFWGVSVPLYLDRGWTERLWRACRARSGRDWMLNSGVLRFDATHAGRRTHTIAAVLFATYPLWLWLGLRHGARR